MRRGKVNKVEAGFRFWLESQNLAEDTVRNYVYGANTWLHWCEENEVDSLDPEREDLRAYLGELLKVRAYSNVELLKISLRRFFGYLMDIKKHPGPNPVTDLPLRKRETEPAEPFTREEFARMLIACTNHQERAVFLLLMGGGLRRSEIFGIKRDDVNLETGMIRVLGKGSIYRWSAPGRAVVEAVWAAMEFSDRLRAAGEPDQPPPSAHSPGLRRLRRGSPQPRAQGLPRGALGGSWPAAFRQMTRASDVESEALAFLVRS